MRARVRIVIIQVIMDHLLIDILLQSHLITRHLSISIVICSQKDVIKKRIKICYFSISLQIF
jgi:hypothetical protein